MAKKTPHCKLSIVQELVETNNVSAMASVFGVARELGIHDLSGMCAVIMALTSANVYKRMTTHAGHRIWQDVCHFKTARADEVYLNLTVIDDVWIVSFKEI
jgi:motility quorum-sensing regulator/GCU-specific mRNA interferase toxin